MIQSSLFKQKKPVRFYQSDGGREPVKDWLKRLPRTSRKVIGRDVLTLQLGWPLGMPLARKLEKDLWEVRTRPGSINARVIFTIQDGVIVLLHGFIKKSRKTPLGDLRIARRRLGKL
jgi:phage-related protein